MIGLFMPLSFMLQLQIRIKLTVLRLLLKRILLPMQITVLISGPERWTFVKSTFLKSGRLAQGSGPRAQGPRPRAQGPGPRAQGPGPRAQGPGPMGPGPMGPWAHGPRALGPYGDAGTPRTLETLPPPVPTRAWAEISQSWKPLTGILPHASFLREGRYPTFVSTQTNLEWQHQLCEKQVDVTCP